eukprot:COSAG06_NODE_4529_length_4153_cov_1.937193_6_plen_293_part_00
MLRAHAGVLAAAAVWAGQLRGSSAETCTGLYDIDISPSSCSSSSCSSYTTIGNGACSSSNCRNHNNNDCDAWDIRCSSGSAVHIDFRTMQTESGWDILYVYEGNSFNSGGARSFSGSSTPTDIQMSGRDAIVAYDTDGSALGSGWSARVRCVSSSSSSSSSSCVDTGYVCYGETEGSTDYCQGWASDSACQRGRCVQPASCVEAGGSGSGSSSSSSSRRRSSYSSSSSYSSYSSYSSSSSSTASLGPSANSLFNSSSPYCASEAAACLADATCVSLLRDMEARSLRWRRCRS